MGSSLLTAWTRLSSISISPRERCKAARPTATVCIWHLQILNGQSIMRWNGNLWHTWLGWQPTYSTPCLYIWPRLQLPPYWTMHTHAWIHAWTIHQAKYPDPNKSLILFVHEPVLQYSHTNTGSKKSLWPSGLANVQPFHATLVPGPSSAYLIKWSCFSQHAQRGEGSSKLL